MKAIADGSALGVDLLTFPELALCSYPPEDLLLKPKFIRENIRSLDLVDSSEYKRRQEPPGIKITSRGRPARTEGCPSQTGSRAARASL